MKYPIKGRVHDLTASMRGQGKRVGGMVRGSMGARTGRTFEIDVQATFGLSEAEAEEVELLGDWDFPRYRRYREDGLAHAEALARIDEAAND
jgi:hypothetical protein